MNTLADILQEVYDILNWDPSPAKSAEDRLKRRVGVAIRDLSVRAPAGFFESTEHIDLEPDDTHASDGDTVAPLQASDYNADEFPSGDKSNPWVFRTTGGILGYTGATTPWNTKRGWDGRLVELTDAEGVVRWNQIRTVWRETFTRPEVYPEGKQGPTPATWQEYRFSVVHPWNADLGVGPYTWRVVTAAYALPGQMLRLNSLYLHKAQKELKILLPSEAERQALDSTTPDSEESSPLWAYRREAVRLEAPATAPTVEHHASAVWKGPEPFGRFKYLLSYTWGKVGTERSSPGVSFFDGAANAFDVSPLNMGARDYGTNRSRPPRWESAPGGVSEEIEVATVPDIEGSGYTPAKAVQLTLPNIEYVMGYLLRGIMAGGSFNRASVARSGLHVRIYRIRSSENFDNYTDLDLHGGQRVTTLHKLDLREEPQLLAEVRIDPANEGIFVDDGTILPDISVKPTSQGLYPSIALYPRPTEADRLDVRCVQAPANPNLLSDTIPVNETGRGAIVSAVVAREAGSADQVLASMHRRLYDEAIVSLNKSVDLTPTHQVMRKRRARAGRRNRT